LSDSFGEFLAEFHWDWFVTLTFADDVKTFTAHRRCEAWLKSLEKAAGQPISWFRGDEYGEKFGKLHIHMLIGNVAGLHRFTWMERWKEWVPKDRENRNGFARIFPFDPTKGAAFYVAKYVTKQFGDWDISGNVDAFRIQQSILPLTGQLGINRGASMPIDSKPAQRRRTSHQLPISDFKEPDLREVAIDPVLASFHDQTVRRR
jgi:hypothetical protein